ncbi:MAG: cupin domain-containing protein [Bacillota bacterium]
MLQELQRMAELYSNLKDPKSLGIVNLHIGGRSYTLRLGPDSAQVAEGVTPAALVDVAMSEETFKAICNGTWTALTAGGRASWSQSAPLDIRLPPGQRLTPELMATLYDLSMHFLNLNYPNVYRFGPGHTRQIHGGHAAAVAYGHGVRFAYYNIREGEQINDEDDRNPWDQVFACIGGRGTAVIDGIEVDLQKGVAVHVPPNKTHVVRASRDEVLELFWLAYGKDA